MIDPPTRLDDENETLPLPVLLGVLIREAQGIGAAVFATGLPAAIVPADRHGLLGQLRRAFRSRSNIEAVGPHLALVDRVERALSAHDVALEEAAVLDAAVPVLEAAPDLSDPQWGPVRPVDLVHASGEIAPMPPARAPQIGTQKWADTIDRLVRNGDDARLVELAVGPGFAESQGALAALCGLSEESISRGKRGHRASGFSDVTREWLRAYLLNPSSPPLPMEKRAGPRARAGAIAPQVWVTATVQREFLAAANLLGGQTAVLDFLVKRYLTQHGRVKVIKAPEMPEGSFSLRVRMDPALLDRLDARVGGAAARAVHLRAAIVDGLPGLRGKRALPQSGTRRSREDVVQTTDACLAVIRKIPGILSDQIAARLGVAPNDIEMPLQHLRDRGVVTCTGAKRFTHYTATG